MLNVSIDRCQLYTKKSTSSLPYFPLLKVHVAQEEALPCFGASQRAQIDRGGERERLYAYICIHITTRKEQRTRQTTTGNTSRHIFNRFPFCPRLLFFPISSSTSSPFFFSIASPSPPFFLPSHLFVLNRPTLSLSFILSPLYKSDVAFFVRLAEHRQSRPIWRMSSTCSSECRRALAACRSI